nr:hypothetical protein [Kocuria indica]
MRTGDTLVGTRLNRLGRSMRDTVNIAAPPLIAATTTTH